MAALGYAHRLTLHGVGHVYQLSSILLVDQRLAFQASDFNGRQVPLTKQYAYHALARCLGHIRFGRLILHSLLRAGLIAAPLYRTGSTQTPLIVPRVRTHNASQASISRRAAPRLMQPACPVKLFYRPKACLNMLGPDARHGVSLATSLRMVGASTVTCYHAVPAANTGQDHVSLRASTALQCRTQCGPTMHALSSARLAS